MNDHIKKSNFQKARHMLCIKMGWMKEYSKFIMRRDPDECNKKAHTEFIKKVTRYLAYNYDVHRCPDTSDFKSLWPSNKPGNQPIRIPPEYTKKNP